MSIIKDFDPLKVIRAALKNGGDFADIYAEETVNTSVVCEDHKIEKAICGMDRGVGIRVISNLKTYYAYTNDVTEAALLDIASVVAGGVRKGAQPLQGADMGYFGAISKKVAPGFAIKKRPNEVTLSDKIALVTRANDTAWKMDKRIRQVRVIFGDAFRRLAIVNSLGDWIEEDRTSLIFLCSAVSKEGDVIQTGYEPLGGAVGLEIFDETTPEQVAQTAAGRALMMLRARRAPGGKMGVVISSEAGGTMIHEAVGHGLEADLAMQNLSVYSGKMGEKVASELVTVIDDGTIPFKRGSSFFDEEGTPTEKTVLVENGVLKSYMYDRLSAMKAGVRSTGNGRRESYHHRPIPRMRNTMIASGKTAPEAIIKSLDKGLFVKKMGGGQVNTVNGDFMFEVTEGYLIEHGKLGEPVRGATLTGNGPEVLKMIDMVGADLGFGIGTCGKDSQGVPVADAQPTLRIPEIVVGGETKG